VPVEKIKPHQHAGIEFLYVIKGSLTLKIASDEYVLETEDAIYFDSGVLHTYRRRGSKACTGVNCHGAPAKTLRRAFSSSCSALEGSSPRVSGT